MRPIGTTHLRSDLEVGNSASYCKTDKTKGIRLVGIDNWDDIRVPVSAVRQNPATTKPDLINFVGGTQILGFDNAASEAVTFVAQIPHSYKEGTDIECHVHWSPTSDAAGGVRWILEYSWANKDSTFPSTATMGATGNTASQNKHIYTDIGEISGTGKTISSMLVGKLIRNVSHTDDDYGADAGLLEIDFHYRKDSFGSDQEGSKTY